MIGMMVGGLFAGRETNIAHVTNFSKHEATPSSMRRFKAITVVMIEQL
jgi:hypothetical protein